MNKEEKQLLLKDICGRLPYTECTNNIQMKQKEKDILYRELSARFPYTLVLDNEGHKCVLEGITYNKGDIRITVIEDGKVRNNCVIENFKPCLYKLRDLQKKDILTASQLRIEHISKMKLKYEDLDNLKKFEFEITNTDGDKIPCVVHEFYGDYGYFNWLYKNHIDFCGLIEMGLAIEAPDGMYR